MVSDTHVLHCSCGATRQAPVGFTILSCVRCGRAMTLESPTAYVPPPARRLVATATLATQLLGTFAFALAVVWIGVLRVTDVTALAVVLAGTACVFAGGNALRGNITALGICAGLDLALAVAALMPAGEAFAGPPLARLGADQYLTVIRLAAAAIAAVAAVTCIVALPQARRFAAWRGAQLPAFRG